MQVSQYLFQSPSPSQVQVGRPDPSVAKEDTTSKSESETTDKVLENTQDFDIEQSKDIKAENPIHILDTYA